MRVVCLLLAFCPYQATQADPMVAQVVMFTDAVWKGGAGIKMGTVTFTQELGSDNVKVSGVLNGLGTANDHGFHIHALGALDGGCVNATSHFNPEKKLHAGPKDAERHVGDLGNIRSDKGVAQLHGPHSIVGRAVVVHALKDDLGRGTGDKAEESKKTGNAGARLGCGIVGIKSGPVNGAPNSRSSLLYVIIAIIFLSIICKRVA